MNGDTVDDQGVSLDTSTQPGLIEFLLGPPTPADGEGTARSASIRFGSAVRDVLNTAIDAAQARTVGILANTPQGQRAKQQYISAQWQSFASSPLTWVVILGVVGYFALKRR